MDGILTEKIVEIWSKARLVDKRIFENKYIKESADEFRLDDMGGIMQKGKFGLLGIYGWNVDYILPLPKGGDDNMVNLRPLHWKNITAKGDDFPTFNGGTGTLTGDRFHNDDRPVTKFTLTYDMLKLLSTIYPNNAYVSAAIYERLDPPFNYITNIKL
jgi:hypothetical protein